MARKEIEDIEKKIEEELARVKQRLIDLQNAKKAARQIYDGASAPAWASRATWRNRRWTFRRRCRPESGGVRPTVYNNFGFFTRDASVQATGASPFSSDCGYGSHGRSPTL